MLITQATLSVVLVAGATMLARSLANLKHQEFGYSARGRVLIGLHRLPSTYTPERLSTLYRDIEERLAKIPAVRGAGLALYNPVGPSGWSEIVVIAGHSPKVGNESAAFWDRVSAGYLQNLGVTILRGRWFTAADNQTAAPVAIVNEAFVKRFFTSTENPLGQHFGLERPEHAGTYRIVGVVHDAKFAFAGLSTPARPMFFVPLAQRVAYKNDYREMIERLSHFVRGIMLVTDASSGELDPLVRKTLADADPNLMVTSIRTVQEQIDLSLNRELAVASLAQLFAMVALVLAAVGVYGVTAYLVTQQTNEIGIRMALGADSAMVMRSVLRQAFQRVAAGLMLGVPVAVAAARLSAAQLYGVSVWDPLALLVAAGSLVACTFLAAAIPAFRAAAISPMNALRAE